MTARFSAGVSGRGETVRPVGNHGGRLPLGDGRRIRVRHLLCFFGGDDVPRRQFLEDAILHPLVAGVALLVGQPAPNQVEAGKYAECLEEAVLPRAGIGGAAAEAAIGQIDQVPAQRLRFVGLL